VLGFGRIHVKGDGEDVQTINVHQFAELFGIDHRVAFASDLFPFVASRRGCESISDPHFSLLVAVSARL
jgi:hypothetical protein